MYCKCSITKVVEKTTGVLIVAKCIVNLFISHHSLVSIWVLIVAKCIVNLLLNNFIIFCKLVLIVAKCIVNNNYLDYN